MHNIKLTFQYDGTRYVGWQTQNSRQPTVYSPQKKTKKQNLRTIQETIEGALGKILQQKIHLIGSGRTDSGVHAISQVANFKAEKFIELPKLQYALNGILPHDIAVVKIEKVPLGFHSRFSVKLKTYQYLVINKNIKTPFLNSYCWVIRSPLDIKLMKSESECLLGRHNFKSFQAKDRKKRRCITTINRISIKKIKGACGFPFLKGIDMISIEIEASGFLRNMVRNIVGTLVEIGRGKIKKGELKKILKEKDRQAAGLCAPARGLYLVDVKY